MRSALLFVLALAFPLSAHAFDLTGTWEGKYTCKGFDGEKYSFTVPGTLEITQTGTVLALALPFDGGADAYNGVGIDDTAKPLQGAAYFVHCGVTDVPGMGEGGLDETGFAKIKTKENGTGSFKATTTYYLGAPREVATCKWSYKRIDTADPVVPSCLP